MHRISRRPFLPRPALRRRPLRRKYAIQTPGAPTLDVFNRHTKYLQKERAAADVETSRKVDYLRDEVASRLCERLLVFTSSDRLSPIHIAFLGRKTSTSALAPLDNLITISNRIHKLGSYSTF